MWRKIKVVRKKIGSEKGVRQIWRQRVSESERECVCLCVCDDWERITVTEIQMETERENQYIKV